MSSTKRTRTTAEALAEYIEQFRARVLQDALNEATGTYWQQRADAFDAVGTPAGDEIARACRARASLSPLPEAPDPDVWAAITRHDEHGRDAAA